MKSLFVLALLIFGFTNLSAQLVANAGPDQTIYLTQTSTATLNGSASVASSFKWTEVSTDYQSGGIITSPNSAVTTVTGLPQGVFYFKLVATSGGLSATDIVAIRVDYAPPPNGQLLRNVPFSSIYSKVNDRHDTLNYIETEWYNNGQSIFFDRCRLPGQYIDPQKGKFYSIIEDGYGWNGNNYARSEMSFGTYFTFDTAKTYCMEWKGYFPQDWSYLKLNQDVAIFMQIHANSDDQHMIGTQVINQGAGPKFVIKDGGQYTVLADLNTFVNQTHTIRVIFREGSAGTGAYYKVEIDGAQKYLKNSGMIGGLPQGEDYPKLATLYDYGRAIVDPSNKTRGRKFSMVTEQFNVFLLNDTQVATPVANAGSNQTITLPTNNVNLSGSGSVSGGTIESYNWTKSSGPTGGVISSPNSQSTSITNLAEGTYVFQLKVTDNNGSTATSTVQINVNPQKQNSAPTAIAGSNQTITLPTNSVNLSGSGTDSDGTIASYLWTKVAGPGSGTITSASSASTTVNGLIRGNYTFNLKVTDNQGATGQDTIHVTVIGTSNIAPTAEGGANQTITLPTNSVNLSGSGTDSDGMIASYLWTKIAGPSSGTIASASSASTTVNGLIQGDYTFNLKVTDNQGASGEDTVHISVKAENNISPIAKAGPDKTVSLPTNSVKLTGSGSDADGKILDYTWTKISGPSTFTIKDSASAIMHISGLVQGVYQFELEVTDNMGAVGKDTVRVIVNAENNIAPTADAGSDKTITLPTNSIQLSGSGADSDGTISSYSWTKISGPSAFSIKSSSSNTTDASGLTQGIYQFELTVTDNKGDVGKDTVQINVNAVDNIVPTANAGENQTITLPINSVDLTGSGSDSDGTIAFYLWTKITGPNAGTITDSLSASTTVNGLIQGDYTFRLKVTDNLGASDLDTVHITVKAALTNILPKANAGINQIISLPANSVKLSGSGSDADGTISSYAWTKISGPSTFSIKNSISAITDVSGLTQGIYQFELKVTDNKGAVGKDTVQVNVNAENNIAPTANAGSDKSITLPTNSIQLSGSGADLDGTISAYSWTKISGPSSFSIQNSSSAFINITGLTQGVYQFELKVTDNKGDVGNDTVQIKVNAANNIAPTANAGTDKTITLPVNSVALSGSGTDSDGSISNYLWTKISGPSPFTIENSSNPTTNVSGLTEGVYQFELKAIDNNGASGTDTIQINVNKSVLSNPVIPNRVPTANAGSDITAVSPVNSISLNGSGSDTDGQIITYSWRQISGPSSSVISSDNTAFTSVSNLIEGTYEFELKVIDNAGAEGLDTLNVTIALGRLAPQQTNVGGLNVYPNPVHNMANLEVNTAANNTNIMIRISDLTGKVVYQKEFVSVLTNVKQKIDMSNLIDGVYIVSVYFDGMEQQSVKVVKL